MLTHHRFIFVTWNEWINLLKFLKFNLQDSINSYNAQGLFEVLFNS